MLISKSLVYQIDGRSTLLTSSLVCQNKVRTKLLTSSLISHIEYRSPFQTSRQCVAIETYCIYLLAGDFESLDSWSMGSDLNVSVTEVTKGVASLETFTVLWGGIPSSPIPFNATESEVCTHLTPEYHRPSVMFRMQFTDQMCKVHTIYIQNIYVLNTKC